ncbi:hypothetical protein ACOMHN_057964 [Nucella lapillus]
MRAIDNATKIPSTPQNIDMLELRTPPSATKERDLYRRGRQRTREPVPEPTMTTSTPRETDFVERRQRSPSEYGHRSQPLHFEGTANLDTPSSSRLTREGTASPKKD